MRPKVSENSSFSRGLLLPSLYLYQDLYLRKKLPNLAMKRFPPDALANPYFVL